MFSFFLDVCGSEFIVAMTKFSLLLMSFNILNTLIPNIIRVSKEKLLGKPLGTGRPSYLATQSYVICVQLVRHWKGKQTSDIALDPSWFIPEAGQEARPYLNNKTKKQSRNNSI